MGFNSAKWVRAGSCEAPYIRKTFMAKDFTEARINICGLGFFQCTSMTYRIMSRSCMDRL